MTGHLALALGCRHGSWGFRVMCNRTGSRKTWQQLEGSENRLVCQGKCVEAWLPREYPWWKQMECGHRDAARIGAAATTAFFCLYLRFLGKHAYSAGGSGICDCTAGRHMSQMMIPLDCVQVAQGSFLRRKSGWCCLERGEKKGCGLKGQQARNVCGAGIAQAPGRLLSFSLWYTSLEHLKARGTLLNCTGLRTSACSD